MHDRLASGPRATPAGRQQPRPTTTGSPARGWSTASSRARRSRRSGMTTASLSVLFTDLVGSTELTSRVGSDRADELRRQHFGALRSAIAGRGHEVMTVPRPECDTSARPSPAREVEAEGKGFLRCGASSPARPPTSQRSSQRLAVLGGPSRRSPATSVMASTIVTRPRRGSRFGRLRPAISPNRRPP